MEDLNITFAHLLTDGSVLFEANAISPDGRYIVGQGYNAATERDEAFLLDTQGTGVEEGSGVPGYGCACCRSWCTSAWRWSLRLPKQHAG
jgi:hypothetical protein